MLKEWLKAAWKFCTEPNPAPYPYPEDDIDMFATSNALQKWIALENFRDHLLTPEYHATNVAASDRHSIVNLNAPKGRK